VTALIPPGEEALWRMAVELAPRCVPPSSDEVARLEAAAAETKPIF